MMDVGKFLGTIRKRQHLTRKQVAERMECPVRAVKAIERGDDVHVSLLMRYARALDTRIVLELVLSREDSNLRDNP